MPMLPEATMFWTFITGFAVILIFIFSMFLIIAFIDSRTFFIDFAPVQTTFPELNINAEVFGSLILITRPGNCSGLYSVFDSVAAIFSRGMSCSNELETTMFTTLRYLLPSLFLTLISFFAIYNAHHK